MFLVKEGRDKRMTRVVVSGNNIDGALRKWKQKVARSGVPSEIKKREHFTKPGVERRAARQEAKRNANKHNRFDRAA
jgi:small subunit ribosomal protein S21